MSFKDNQLLDDSKKSSFQSYQIERKSNQQKKEDPSTTKAHGAKDNLSLFKKATMKPKRTKKQREGKKNAKIASARADNSRGTTKFELFNLKNSEKPEFNETLNNEISESSEDSISEDEDEEDEEDEYSSRERKKTSKLEKLVLESERETVKSKVTKMVSPSGMSKSNFKKKGKFKKESGNFQETPGGLTARSKFTKLEWSKGKGKEEIPL